MCPSQRFTFKELQDATGPRLLNKHFRIPTGALGTRTGRAITLALLVVGGGLSFAAWLQTELNPALHSRATAVGKVSHSSNAPAPSAESRVSNVVQSSEVMNAPAAPVETPPDIDSLPRVRQVAKSAPRPVHMESPIVLNQASRPQGKAAQQSREPSFMSTFAHH